MSLKIKFKVEDSDDSVSITLPTAGIDPDNFSEILRSKFSSLQKICGFLATVNDEVTVMSNTKYLSYFVIKLLVATSTRKGYCDPIFSSM